MAYGFPNMLSVIWLHIKKVLFTVAKSLWKAAEIRVYSIIIILNIKTDFMGSCNSRNKKPVSIKGEDIFFVWAAISFWTKALLHKELHRLCHLIVSVCII
jgi:hypothetical protein